MTDDVAGTPGSVSLPPTSVVLEWDNPRQNPGAAPASVHSLARELRDADAAELLVVHHQSVRGEQIRQVLEAAGLGSIDGLELHVIDGGDAYYYDLKTIGARQAKGDVIVFVDSDVVLEPGWWTALTAPFADPRILVVGSVVELGPLGSRRDEALALFWRFPPADHADGLVPSRGFRANSVAFRRSTYLDHPFPHQPDRIRGQCGQLAATLRAEGITIWSASDARVTHPPPPGWRGMLGRALADGADGTDELRSAGTRPTRLLVVEGPRWALGRLRRDLQRVRTYRTADLGVATTAVYLSVATVYGLARLTGLWLAQLMPSVRQWLR